MSDAGTPPVKGVDFFQSARPQGWNLEDIAILPGGAQCTGTKARVYNLLAEARRRNHQFPVGRHLAPAGWVPTWVLREVWSGGAAGDRRVRDLREAGVVIQGEIFDAGEAGSSSYVWRLGDQNGTPPLADRQNQRKKADAAEKQVSKDSPLAGLSFSIGPIPEGAGGVPVVDLRGSASPLSPPPVFSDELAAAESYRQQLLALYRCGSLALSLQDYPALHFLVSDEQRPFLAVLSRALQALGATQRLV
jgi:hypothetical protein